MFGANQTPMDRCHVSRWLVELCPRGRDDSADDHCGRPASVVHSETVTGLCNVSFSGVGTLLSLIGSR